MNLFIISSSFIIIILLIETNITFGNDKYSRALNSSALLASKYNHVVRPTISTHSSTTKNITTTPESRYSPSELLEDDHEEEDDDDDDDDEDDEDEDEEEEEDEETIAEEQIQQELEDVEEVFATTQRSKGKPTMVNKTKNKNKKNNKEDESVKTKRKHWRIHKKKHKGLKKLKKYMLPLLLAYKLKFFTLIPLLLGGLVLIVATTGFAGFFFALFAVGVGLKKD